MRCGGPRLQPSARVRSRCFKVEIQGIEAAPRALAVLQGTVVLPDFVAADELTLAKYACYPFLELWRLVLLHSNVDPDFVDVLELKRVFARSRRRSREQRLYRNMRQACEALAGKSLKPFDSRAPRKEAWHTELLTADFQRWAAVARLPAISGWPVRPVAATVGAHYCFPHGTKKLGILAKVARQCADLERGEGSWPKADVVEAKFCEHHFSQHLAKTSATLIRPDELARGRPGRRGRGRHV